MKQKVAKRLVLIIGTTMMVILMLNLLIQRNEALIHMQENAVLVIQQIEHILKRNEQEILKKNEVRYMISQMPVSEGSAYYVVDKESGKIIGATNTRLVNRYMDEVVEGFDEKWLEGKAKKSQEDNSFYYFGESKKYYIGVSQTEEIVYGSLSRNMGQLMLYLFVAAYMMIAVCMRMLDRLIIQGVDEIVDGVEAITNGEFNTVINVENTPELKRLSENINQMTGSLLEQNTKITHILETIDVQLVIYEYGKDNNKVFATGKVGAVLMLSEEETKELLRDKRLFEKKIEEIRQYPVEGLEKIYRLPVDTECYLQLDTFQNQQNEFGIIMDVTEDVIEKQNIQKERDYDLLTGLMTRRAFYRRMKKLYENPEQIKNAVLLMCDLDGLKTFNDTYGHANGDKAIKKAAEIVSCIKENNIEACRLSGDEFACFIYGEENGEYLKYKLQQIYETMMAAEIEIYDKKVPVRLSGGYVFCTERDEELDKLLKKSDLALYESKEKGRARFTEYTGE